jgi:hypothetical protein
VAAGSFLKASTWELFECAYRFLPTRATCYATRRPISVQDATHVTRPFSDEKPFESRAASSTPPYPMTAVQCGSKNPNQSSPTLSYFLLLPPPPPPLHANSHLRLRAPPLSLSSSRIPHLPISLKMTLQHLHLLDRIPAPYLLQRRKQVIATPRQLCHQCRCLKPAAVTIAVNVGNEAVAPAHPSV